MFVDSTTAIATGTVRQVAKVDSRYGPAKPQQSITLDRRGVTSDFHALRDPGRALTERDTFLLNVSELLPRDSIRNLRQMQAVADHEVRAVSQELQADITPSTIRANLVLSFDDPSFHFSDLPRMTVLVIGTRKRIVLLTTGPISIEPDEADAFATRRRGADPDPNLADLYRHKFRQRRGQYLIVLAAGIIREDAPLTVYPPGTV